MEVLGNNKKTAFPKAKLLQIIGNLISNAIKFTPAGGKVTISLDLTKKNQKRELLVKIRDTDVGLTEEQIEAIVKADGNTT